MTDATSVPARPAAIPKWINFEAIFSPEDLANISRLMNRADALLPELAAIAREVDPLIFNPFPELEGRVRDIVFHASGLDGLVESMELLSWLADRDWRVNEEMIEIFGHLRTGEATR